MRTHNWQAVEIGADSKTVCHRARVHILELVKQVLAGKLGLQVSGLLSKPVSNAPSLCFCNTL